MRNSLFLLLLLCFAGASVAQLPGSTTVTPDTSTVFRNLDDALKNPAIVYHLDLSKKKLDSIPRSIFSLIELRSLNLSRNKISELPGDIGKLIKLKNLDLSNNDLEALPDSIGNLSSLIYLRLNRNKIVRLPPSIGNLENLEVLEMWDNELSDIPDEIQKLKNLKVIELRGILFSQEEQTRIDSLVVKTAKLYMSPSCNCKY
ncbi:MAG: leucine-rich repeat domain-containing protein [Bacteroidia bacterium]|nr:leucine-rich repeat domain-containing protein [Bacteroidia bacterium]